MRLRGPRRVLSSDAQEVVPVTWRGLPYPAVWQEIGAFALPPGNRVVSIYPGPQRRNGVGDISSEWQAMYNPQWVNQYPVVTPGTQRAVAAGPHQGPSRYGVYKMRKAVTAAQVREAGANLLPFLNNPENPVVTNG